MIMMLWRILADVHLSELGGIYWHQSKLKTGNETNLINDWA